MENLESSICHFICSGCRTVLSIPESAFASRGYSLNCELCSKPISIRPVSTDSSMEVLELFGCQYAGKGFPREIPTQEGENVSFETSGELKEAVGTWIADSMGDEEPFKPEKTPEVWKSSFADNLVTKWEVHRKSGEVYQFETFALIRQWVEQGKITSGDEIIPTGGTKHLVETYPGTADLFGNVLEPTHARQAFAAKAAQRRIRRKRIRQAFSVLVAVVLAGGLASAPYGLRWWSLREGKAFVGGLVAGVPQKGRIETSGLLAEAEELLRQGTSESFPRAATLFLQILALKPNDPEILSRLAETWTEVGVLTGDKEEFNRARMLIRYAKALDKNHPSVRRADARWLWRTGKADDAMALIEKQEISDLDSQLLLAKIAVAKGDYTRATISLSEVLKREPNNIPFLLALVELFEKQSKFNEAASYLKRVEFLAPDPEPYTERLKTIYKNASDFDSLETLYRKSVATRSKGAEPDQFELIKLLYSQNRGEEVIQESLDYFAEHPEGAYYADVKKLYESALTGRRLEEEKKSTEAQKTQRPARSRRFRKGR